LSSFLARGIDGGREPRDNLYGLLGTFYRHT